MVEREKKKYNGQHLPAMTSARPRHKGKCQPVVARPVIKRQIPAVWRNTFTRLTIYVVSFHCIIYIAKRRQAAKFGPNLRHPARICGARPFVHPGQCKGLRRRGRLSTSASARCLCAHSPARLVQAAVASAIASVVRPYMKPVGYSEQVTLSW